MTETRYTPEMAEAILKRVAEGESLRQVCRSLNLPESSVREWARDNREGFGAAYQQARQMQLESWSDHIVELADRADLTPGDRRVRIDTRKWLMSKLAPRQFGDKVTLSGDMDNPFVVMHQQVSLDTLSGPQLDALERLTTALLVVE